MSHLLLDTLSREVVNRNIMFNYAQTAFYFTNVHLQIAVMAHGLATSMLVHLFIDSVLFPICELIDYDVLCIHIKQIKTYSNYYP